MPPLSEERKKREILLVVGKTGTGKSYWMKDYVSQLKRVIILDPMDEYPGILYEDIEDVMDAIDGKETFRVRTANLPDLPDLCKIAMACTDVHLVVEEAQRAIPPSGKELPEDLKDVIFRGRHHAVSLCMVSQRPSKIHIDPRSQWTRIVTFAQNESVDVDWMEQTSGFDIGDLRHLGIGHYLEITPGTLERRSPIKARRTLHHATGKETNILTFPTMGEQFQGEETLQ